MAIKPKRSLRERQALDSTIEQFLLTGTAPPRDTPGWRLYVSRFFDGGEAIRQAWAEHGEALLAKAKMAKKTEQKGGDKNAKTRKHGKNELSAVTGEKRTTVFG